MIAASSFWCSAPMLVSQWLCQRGAISSTYSSRGGMEERVTRILSYGLSAMGTLRCFCVIVARRGARADLVRGRPLSVRS